MVARNRTRRTDPFDDFGTNLPAPAGCPPLLANSPLTLDVGRTTAALKRAHTTRLKKHDLGELWNAPDAPRIYSPREDRSSKPWQATAHGPHSLPA
ncbi:hypothetical protein C2845_PM15G03470 [Panicum miliaceum]|uniref:Uncharacterized protein n=1 Tax=Panicum miliaceum TaxID=4540 RepID=A0A3L6Q375_PANMI|nr:hypothetical protein C2845_PM15G03470 [Panicum miliaceum]